MNWKLAIPLSCCLALGHSVAAFAHGVVVESHVGTAIQIDAIYDTGEPMAGGQVTVYSPEDPSTPWLTGVTDEEGRFVFMPDLSKAGGWDIQVRQAGHGEIVRVDVGSDAATTGEVTTAADSTGYSMPQILLMSASGIWGFVGTALFFSRQQK